MSWNDTEVNSFDWSNQYVDVGYQKVYPLPEQNIFSKHEYTEISRTEETIFATDETGAPHVFTIEEWERMNGGISPAGLLLAAAVIVGVGWLIF